MDIGRLESFVFDKMASSRLPGLSLALVREGEIMYSRGFGQRDLRNGLPATPNTLYSIGSITKSFTALAILQLAERGLLDLGDPVERFVPFPIKPMGELVTLEHLLTHTSGIPALAYSEALMGHANETGGRWLPIAGPEDVLTFMDDAHEWAESRPGERWAYANEGYAILGLIVERVAGKPYGEYLKEEILAPLEMSRSFLSRSEVEAAEDVAVPYVLPEGGLPRPGHYLYRRIRSEGGLVSSVLDLARYLGMFLGGGQSGGGQGGGGTGGGGQGVVGKGGGGQGGGGQGVVTAETLTQMTRPRIEAPFRTQPGLLGSQEPSEAAQHYGYGLSVERFLGRRLVGHGGNVLVSTAHLAFLPEDGLGVAVLANGNGYPMAQIARAALAVALGTDPLDLPENKVHHELDRLTGRYRTYRGTMEATVERHGDFLKLRFVDRANPDEIILVPEDLGASERRFFTLSEGRLLPVTFRHRDDGPELLFERHKLRRTGVV